MDLLIRPYSTDGKLVEAAVSNGARVSGLVVDAHIAKLAPNAMRQTRSYLRGEGSFLIDPVTFKIRYPFFRAKTKSFQRLPYYFTAKFPKSVPTIRDLESVAQDGASKVLEVEREFGATEYITPYLYASAQSFRNRSGLNEFRVSERWTREFLQLVGDQSVYASICLSASCLTDPDGLIELKRYFDQLKPQMVYMLLFDYELGENRVVDEAVRDFFAMLRTKGIRRIVYSHAPPWIYFMEDYGIDAFVSGINYLTTLKEEYLTRDEGIGSVEHNYYIPRRFCRMNVKQAFEALRHNLFPACRCPACDGSIPSTQNLIREHYIHVKAAECDELRRKNPRDVLIQWAKETEEFLYETELADLKVYGAPKPRQWLSALS